MAYNPPIHVARSEDYESLSEYSNPEDFVPPSEIATCDFDFNVLEWNP